MKSLLAVLVVALTVGCTTVPPDVKTETLTSQTSPNDVLRITNARVIWVENSNTEIVMKFGVPAELHTLAASAYVLKDKGYLAGNANHLTPPVDPKINPALRETGQKYINQFIDVQRRFSATKLAGALDQHGIKVGDDFKISITPIAVYHAVDGFGTNLVLNTEFEERATNKKWSTLIVVKSGILWTGVSNASAPTEAFAESYVEQLLAVLKKSRSV